MLGLKHCFAILVVLAVLGSCSQFSEKEQPKILVAHCGFDLKKVTFNENVPLLFSESLNWSLQDDDGNPDSEELAYYPFNPSEFLVTVHCDQFGYLYKSKPCDSIAALATVYFDKMDVLTDMDTVMVAIHCEAELPVTTNLNSILSQIKLEYGDCSVAYHIDNHYEHFSYEWDLTDRILQVETSKGFSFTLSENPVCTEYYDFEVLLIKKEEHEKLVDLKTIKIEDYNTIFIKDRFVTNTSKFKIERPDIFEYITINPEDLGF